MGLRGSSFPCDLILLCVSSGGLGRVADNLFRLLLRVFIRDRWTWHFELLNHVSYSALTLESANQGKIARCFFVLYDGIRQSQGALVLGAVVGFDKGFSFPNLYIYIILNLCGESKNFFQSPRRFLIAVVEVDFVVIWIRVIAEPVANGLQVVGHAQVANDNLASVPA